jgi:threonine-phosphate decarboxylase
VRGIARAHGRRVDDYLDFSANINPLGPPAGVRALVRAYADDDRLTRYPEPGLPELTAVLARVHRVEPPHIVVHAGSAALFDVILRACAPRRLGMCVPAFAEYARAAAANAIPVRTFALDVEGPVAFDAERFCTWVRRDAIDAVVLTNPHNPLGFALRAQTIDDLRARLPATTIIVDEAFADYAPTSSVATAAARDAQLIVVRSVTKFYAMPDLRVGYAVMTAQRAHAVSRYLPAWPVSGIAAAAAQIALADNAYAADTLATNDRNRAGFAEGLARAGLRVLPSAANFLTFGVAGAAALAERLLTDHQIIVRNCSSFAGLAHDAYIRVAVRSRSDNTQLLAAL